VFRIADLKVFRNLGHYVVMCSVLLILRCFESWATVL